MSKRTAITAAMSEQLSLPGMAESSAPLEDLFFALLPASEAKFLITKTANEFSEEQGLRGKLVDEARYHVTALFVGDVGMFGKTAIQSMSQAAAAVASTTDTFRLELNRIGGFGARGRLSPLALHHQHENPAFSNLAQHLHKELLRKGIRPKKGPSSKLHLTLCYRETFVEATPITPIGWQVTELVLIKSLLGKGQHVQLGRWPLRMTGEGTLRSSHS